MKKLLLPCFLAAIFLAGLTSLTENANAQSTTTLIHYWYFPEFSGSLTYTDPNVPNIYEDYDVNGDTTKAWLQYYLLPGTSDTFGSLNTSDQLDGVAAVDPSVANGGNARLGLGPNVTALRVRNPVDSIELRWHMPTTGITNPVITYALESSSTTSGDSEQIYSYSDNGGATWKTAAIWVNGVSTNTLCVACNANYQGSLWGLVVITFTGDDSINNNPNFIFRITYQGNTAKYSGNNRYADVTMDGGGSGGGGTQPAKITVATPISGNIFVPGQQETITFTTQNVVGQGDTIKFSTNGGSSWATVGITPAGATSYTWTVPNVQTDQGLIEVVDSGVTGVSGMFPIYPITSSNLIVHYWDFNTVTQAYHIPNIPPLPADFSATSAHGMIIYDTLPGTSNTNLGYLDNVVGDTASADALFGEPAGQALRVRNPTDSMDLRFVIPTTGYQGITLHYALQSSSFTAPQVEKFSYSTDGGQIWVGAGTITVNGADSVKDTLDVTQSQYQAAGNGVFGPVSIGFTPAVQSAISNNPSFMFRILFGDTATGGTSGNNRFDNFTVMAQSQVTNGVTEPVQAEQQVELSPNPAGNDVTFANPFASQVAVSVIDMTGREVLQSNGDASSVVDLNISDLASGAYYVRIHNVATGVEQIAKFVKQ